MRKEIRLKARPSHLLNEQNYSFIHFFLMKISPFISYFLARHSKIKPNSISIISIIFLISSFFSLYNKDYATAFIFLMLNFLTDNIDGELARLKKQISALGEKLEKINSNLFYLFFFNIILFHFYNDNLININFLISFVSISILHFFVRGKISHINLKKKIKYNSFNLIYLGLFKYSSQIRNKSLYSKIVFIFIYNILFSGGISELFIIILLVLKLNNFALYFLIFNYLLRLIYTILLIIIKLAHRY